MTEQNRSAHAESEHWSPFMGRHNLCFHLGQSRRHLARLSHMADSIAG